MGRKNFEIVHCPFEGWAELHHQSQPERLGGPVLVRWHFKRTMCNLKNSFSPDFVYIHTEKYIFFRDMFCLYHFWAKNYNVNSKYEFWITIPFRYQCNGKPRVLSENISIFLYSLAEDQRNCSIFYSKLQNKPLIKQSS